MPKIVYISHGLISPLNCSFELSRRLSQAGHEVIYLCQNEIGDAVRAQGYGFYRLEGCIEIKSRLTRMVRSGGGRRRIKNLVRALLAAMSWRRDSMQLNELQSRIDEIGPDLLIVDCEMHYAILSLLKSKYPMVLSIEFFSIFRRPGLPPLHTGLLPAEDARQSWRIRAAWWRLLSARLAGRLFSRFRLKEIRRNVMPIDYATNRVADLRKLARVRGLRLGPHTDWTQWLKPHVYPEIKSICCNAKEMELPHDPPANVTYIGPLVHRTRIESGVSTAERKAWQEFCNAWRDKSNSPLIYCSLGTYWSGNDDLLHAILDVFDKKPGWHLVMGLGSRLSKLKLRPSGDNVLLMDYAPQLEILELAAAAITHGGVATINECVLNQVPMVVLSTGHVDQDGNAARVRYHRLGVVSEKRQPNTSELTSMLDRALVDEEIRQNLSRMKDHFERYERDRVAEKVLERAMRESK